MTHLDDLYDFNGDGELDPVERFFRDDELYNELEEEEAEDNDLYDDDDDDDDEDDYDDEDEDDDDF